MNVRKALHIEHQQVLTTTDAVTNWEQVGVCGAWSTKDVLAHLTSYEQLLIEALESIPQPDTATPLIDAWRNDLDAFNERQVEQRSDMPPETIMAEYKTAYEKAAALLAELSTETLRRKGIFDWYGEAYDLEDLLVYQYYGHKCTHLAQIETFQAGG